MASETTPLFPTSSAAPRPTDPRQPLHNFLEAASPAGLAYERFTIFLILLSVLTFILSSLFLPYNSDWDYYNLCGKTCDAIWFGNYENALNALGLGNTSLVELLCVAVFTVDYLVRLYTADLISDKYAGFGGRVRYLYSFFSLVDLASIVPFYIDALVLRDTDWMASNFVRMFRLLRMMKVEGRYDLALGLVDDVIVGTRGVAGVALFVGATVWGVMSSFFYIAERLNPDMIYCGAAPDSCGDVDTSLCTINSWGLVDCTKAGCPPITNEDGTIEETCWNLYRSIVSSSFWTLMELFGEFPLMDQHSVWGQILGTITTVFAAAVFALPAGIFGSGFESEISKRREEKRSSEAETELSSGVLRGGIYKMDSDAAVGNSSTLRGAVYNFLYLQTTTMSKIFDIFMDGLVVATTIIFMLDTVANSAALETWHGFFDAYQTVAFLIFSAEYILLMYSVGENPKFRGTAGMITYAQDFLRIVDLLSILPFWIMLLLSPVNPSGHEALYSFAKFCLVLRILRFEKYSEAFTTFDDVIRENLDVLTVTGFSASLLWVLFSSILYLTERSNPDDEMAARYKTVPHAMWITLLNLSGECPLAHYSSIGKILVGVIGLFATAIFGVPIGVLGAGFEELVADKIEDTPDQDTEVTPTSSQTNAQGIQASCYKFVNGIGSKAAFYFEMSIYGLIVATVSIGIIQTADGYENAFTDIELMAVIVFTFEYIIRFIGVGADPEFGGMSFSRIRFIFSFYSVVDLLAIVPYYMAAAMPGSWVDAHDEYFRMLRLLRLLKLDKYVPSITLIDDVIRLKRKILLVSCFVAGTLTILFSGLMYLAEHNDFSMPIDNLPLYGCFENCTESVRYTNMFTSIPLTGIHLTGDFPIIEYNSWGRVILFFAVVAAVGVVAIPSGVVASGFVEIVDSKNRNANESQSKLSGDDWFDVKYRELEGKAAPRSIFGPTVDYWQYAVKEYLDGTLDSKTGHHSRTRISMIGRAFFFVLIITNVLAVILESVPEIDEAVGNQKGNFFDVFEAWSVFFFSIDYAMRLFSARKSREALFSPWVYATTFFGIVDFMTIAPWYFQMILISTGHISGDEAKVFRIVRIFRVLQLEDFLVAFSKLDNVFRASKDVLKATGLMAMIIWVGSSALFFLFESNNPNFRECNDSVPLIGTKKHPGCYDFESTAACNEVYPGMCNQIAFTNMPSAMYYVAVFLGGEWGVVDFTWKGKLVCMFLCVAGIALYSIPVGTLFDSFGAVIGLSEEEEDEEEGEEQKEE